MNFLKILFLLLCSSLIVFNVFQLTHSLTPPRHVVFLGTKFSGIEDVLKAELKVGYITDFNLNETAPLAEYEQAQYVLAPVILEINNPRHRFFIINCSNDAVAAFKLKELGARAIMRNNFGIILAQNAQRTLEAAPSTVPNSP